MKTINKGFAYARLKNISESKKLNVSKYMAEVAKSTTVPESVIIFINRYYPIEQFYTYNKIYENRRKNNLYKNLVNESLPDHERAIALTSYMTQVLIHSKDLIKDGKINDSREFLEYMNIPSISRAVSLYSDGDNSKMTEVALDIRECFKRLFG